MKKILLLIALAAFLTGCASLSDPQLLKPLSPVAVVSIRANDQLYYFGDQPPQASLLGAATNITTNTGNSNSIANTLLEKTDKSLAFGVDALLKTFSESGIIKVIPQNDVLNSAAYKAATDDAAMNVVFLKPVGYKFIKANDQDLAGALNRELKANGSVIATFKFQKQMKFGAFGTGSLGAYSALTIAVYDAAGKLIFMKSYEGQSKGDIGVAANVYDPVKFTDLSNDATLTAITAFSKDLKN